LAVPAIVGTVILAALGALLLWPGPTLDPNKVVVFPMGESPPEARKGPASRWRS
jgi:hypothetical protein